MQFRPVPDSERVVLFGPVHLDIHYTITALKPSGAAFFKGLVAGHSAPAWVLLGGTPRTNDRSCHCKASRIGHKLHRPLHPHLHASALLIAEK
eukprot:5021172-Pyramimonas_sp.AAC.1